MGAQNIADKQQAMLMVNSGPVLARPRMTRELRREPQQRRMMRLSWMFNQWNKGVTTRLPRLLQRVQSML